jgi:capsule assembly protein Wzi
MRQKITLFLFFALFSVSYAQVEMVAPSNRIYAFLERMDANKIIVNYSSSMIPISRREIARYLEEIKSKENKISKTDRKLLNDFLVEFEYDIDHSLHNASPFLSNWRFSDIFSDKKQKYLYSGADSNSSIFWDVIGELRYMGANGDSLGKPHILLMQAGTRIRGTLFNSVGYYLRLSNGVRLSSNGENSRFAAEFDPVLASTKKFVGEGGKTFDSFEGYLRYSPPTEWIALTAGREAMRFGAGFIDKLLISNNTAPFDFIKLDLSYKKIKYSFLHASIVGNDSNGQQLESKYLVFHRLELGPLANGFLRLAFNEMLIYSNIPINLAFLNPIAFLTSADLNTELPGKNTNNTLIALDAQLFPVKKLKVQGTFLIDDLNFETLGKSGPQSNDNKFAYQWGLNWQDAFTVSNLGFTYEYTRVNPFVYSHRDYNNSYAHWGLPLGAALNPNSDEHAVKVTYDFGSRLNISVAYKHQRSGENLLDSNGNIVINYGSNILDGRNDYAQENIFLNGIRINRNIITAEISWQPIRQYYFILRFMKRSFDYVDNGRTLSDNIFQGILRVDY